jgi:hypothetical protein
VGRENNQSIELECSCIARSVRLRGKNTIGFEGASAQKRRVESKEETHRNRIEGNVAEKQLNEV